MDIVVAFDITQHGNFSENPENCKIPDVLM